MSNQPGDVQGMEYIDAADLASGDEKLRPGAREKVSFPDGIPLTEMDIGTATDDQVLTASAGGAAFETPNALGSYDDIVVVDAGGNGDYDDFYAAYDTEGNDKVYYIFGDVAISANVEVDGEIKIIGPGSLTRSTVLILDDGAKVTIDGGVHLVGNISISPSSEIDDATLVVNNALVSGRIRTIGYVASKAILEINAGGKVVHDDGEAIAVSSISEVGACILTINNGLISSGTGDGIVISDIPGNPLDVTESLITNSHISGATDAITADFAISPLVYLSLLTNGVNANVTLPVGGNNVEV